VTRKAILAGAALLVLALAAILYLPDRPSTSPDRPQERLPPTPAEPEVPAPPPASATPTVHGIVVDLLDRPVPEAAVKLVRRRRNEPDYEVLAETVADSTGVFETIRPGPKEHEDDYFFFEAAAPGFARATHYLSDGTDEERIVLSPARPFQVTVFEDLRRPLSGARVYVSVTGPRSWYAIEHTDVDGLARFALPPGPVSVYVSCAGRVAKAEEVAEDRESIEIHLSPTSDLLGLVLEEGSGEPIGGVTVKLGKREVTTETDGRFSLPDISPGDKLSFSGPWHLADRVQLSDVPAGESFERTFTLAPAGRISGLVLTADGKPAAGAWVHTEWPTVGLAYRPGREPGGSVVPADVDGRFTLTGVKPGEGLRVFAALRGHTAGASAPVSLRPHEERDEVVVHLGPPAAAKIDVRAEDGATLKEISVEYRCPGADPWAPLDGLPRVPDHQFYRGPPGLLLQGFTGRPFDLYIHADGYRTEVLPETEVVPAAGLPVRKVLVVLERGLSISGVLLSRTGKPVERATIHVNRGREELRKRIPFACLHARTDRDGRFRLFGLPPGEYCIHATCAGGRTEVMDGVAAGSENLELRLK
jgi:Carboxypeptidase regulatory-like domain